MSSVSSGDWKLCIRIRQHLTKKNFKKKKNRNGNFHANVLSFCLSQFENSLQVVFGVILRTATINLHLCSGGKVGGNVNNVCVNNSGWGARKAPDGQRWFCWPCLRPSEQSVRYRYSVSYCGVLTRRTSWPFPSPQEQIAASCMWYFVIGFNHNYSTWPYGKFSCRISTFSLAMSSTKSTYVENIMVPVMETLRRHNYTDAQQYRDLGDECNARAACQDRVTWINSLVRSMKEWIWLPWKIMSFMAYCLGWWTLAVESRCQRVFNSIQYLGCLTF